MTVVSEADASEWDTEDVTLAPVLEAVEPNVRVQEGDDAILKLTVSSGSDLPLNIHWTRGGGESLDGDRFVADSGGGGVLRIRGARRSDSGPYRARAVVGGGGDCPHVDYELDVYPAAGDVPAFLRRLTDLAVKVGTRTRLLVEIRSATQVKTAWLRQGKEVVPDERLHFLNEGSFFCLDVAPVTLEDSGEWAVIAQNVEGRATCSCFLNVLVPKAYKKPVFVEQLRAVLTAASGTVSLECKVIGVPTPQLKWFKDGAEIRAGDVFALSADPADPTTLGTYTCEATNCMGKATSSSRVHVVPAADGSQPHHNSLIPSGPVPKFKENLKDQKVKIGGSLLLENKVEVPPWPENISWFNAQGLVEEGGRYHIMADGLGGYSVSVNPVEAVDQGQWKCVATSNLGLKSITACNVAMSFPKNYRAPRFLEALRAVLTEEGLVSFECKVVGFPTPQLQWFKDGQELKPGDVYQLTGSNSLGSYCCIARNCMGEARSTAELTVEDIQNQLTEEEKIQLAAINRPPQFQVGLKSCQAEINQPFRFTVQVTVNPEPVVTWFRDDEELQGSENYSFLKEAHGFCHLSIQRLELIDQAEWKCVATNDYGQSVTSCFLKLNIPRHFKKPRFLECLRAVLSEEGAVNLECKVIGVPQPVLKWYKDGKELCPGDIHKIISGEDGTCCLGVYTCEAHNCMGTVSSSASLLGFEQKPQEKSSEQAASALALTRQPSLSTIQEERSSQMHSITIDDRQEVSFSFDGKEVSVSLYETPDLTEEEALQVVEMYAEELSEHVSEHNVVELPPMRFVKETSTSGHILMEAVVIDVSPDFYASAEDDLRTDADLEEFSISEEAYLQNANLSMQDDLPFDKINSDFLERALSGSLSYDDVERRTSPAKPKRKSRDSSSASESKKKHLDDDSSGPYSDALASEKESKSQKDSFVSAIESPDRDMNVVKVFETETAKSSSVNVDKTVETIKRTLDEPVSMQEKKKKRSKSRSVSKERNVEEKVASATIPRRSLSKDKESPKEKSSDESSKNDSNRAKKIQKHSRRKSKTVDSEAEDDSLQEFERRKVLESSMKIEVESDQMTSPETQKRDKVKSTDSEREDDSLIEFETRKSISLKEQLAEKRKNRDHSLKRGAKKRGSTDSSGKEDDSLVEYEKRKNLSVTADDKSAGSSSKLTRAKKGSLTKKGSSESSGKEDEAQKGDTEKKRKKKSTKQTTTTVQTKELTPETGVEVIQSSETDSVGKAIEMRRGREAPSDVDSIKTSRDGDDETAEFDTAEDSAYDRSEMSVLESLTQSLQEMQRGLAVVGEQIKSSSSEEPESAKSSLSVLESLAQPINDIKKGIRTVEKQIMNDSQTGDYSPSKANITILETIAQPVQELQRTLALVEQKSSLEGDEDTSILERTSQSILETVAQPLQEFNREMALIQQQAVLDVTDDSFETIQSFKPQLIEVQGGVLQSEKDLSSRVEELSEITMDTQSTYAQSVQELQKGLAQIVERHVYDSDKTSNDDLLPLTVKEIQEDLLENENFIRELKEFEIRIMKDSEVYFDRMDSCMQNINSKIAKAEDEEMRDLLNSVRQMIAPLNSLQSITSKCIENVAENPSCLQWDVRLSKDNIMHSLTRPFEVLDGTIDILGKVADCDSDRETRRICIASLYKLTVPMDELKTTVKLVENLSPQTAIEFLLPPVDNMLSAISGVNSELIRPEFVDNVVVDGGNVLKGLDDSLDIMINCINSIEKYSSEMQSSHKEENITSLSTLTKPLEVLQNNLHSLEKFIVDESQLENLNDSSQLYHLVQELGKPLQNIRIELSIIKHQIELEEYSSFTLQPSAIIRDGNTRMFQLLEPVENMQKNVTCFHEAVLSKSPDEPLHLRYVLYALSTLTQPMNVLCSTIMKTEEQILQEIPSVSDPSVGLRIVTQSVSELRQSIESIKHQSHEILLQPELLIISDILSTLSSPLLEVEAGLGSLSDQVYDEDKTALNINLLKTMAEPFKALQKALIEISNELSSENISEAVVFELKQPVQELQRSILVIQDQVSFEYGDEPTTIESNIVTLQSLIQPMKTLKRHFINVQKVIAEQNKSVDIQLAQKLIDISKVMHKLQLKVSSMMVQQSYFRVSKHSGRLELFPILQHLVQFISDFERAQQITVQHIERKHKLDVVKLKEKILNNMQYLKMDMLNLHKKLNSLKDLSPSDSNSTEILTKAIHEFTNALMDECAMLADETPEEGSALACLEDHFESFVEHINILHSKLLSIEAVSSDKEDKEKMKQRITFQDQSPKKVKILDLSLNALQGKLLSMMNVVEHNLQNESAGLSVQIIENMMSCTNAIKENITSLKMETKLTDLKEADETCNRAVEELRDCMALLTSEMNNVSDMFSESSVRSLSATVENITACQVDISKKLEDIILSVEERDKAPQLDECTDQIPKKDEIMGSINIVNENIKQKLVKISDADSSHRKIILSEPVQCLTAQLSDLSTNIFSSDIKSEALSESQVKENLKIMSDINSSLLKLEDDVKKEESITTEIKEQVIASVKNLQKAVTSITEDVKENQTISAFDQIIEPLNDFNETIVGHDDNMKPKLSPLRAVMGEEYNEAETLKETSFRILEEFARASSELEFGLMKVEHNLLNISEMKKGNIVTVVEPLVQPIQQLCEKVAMVEEILLDPTVEEHMSSLSMLKTLAEPIRDIQRNIVEIQEHCMESTGKRESGEKVLQVIAKPIRELRSGVALIQEQAMVMEADALTISESLSSSETLAKPLEELKQVLTSIVNQQAMVYEPGTESMSEAISELKTIAEPVRELQKQLAAIETQQLLDGGTVDISVKEAIATVAKPVTELRYAIATIENQIALESTDSIESDKYALIKALEKSLYEVSKGIACINEQQVLEDVVSNSTLSDVPTMASPVESPLLTGLEIHELTVLDGSSLLVGDEKQKGKVVEDAAGLSATSVEHKVMKSDKPSSEDIVADQKELKSDKSTSECIVAEKKVQKSVESKSENMVEDKKEQKYDKSAQEVVEENLLAKKMLIGETKTPTETQQSMTLESGEPLPQLELKKETAVSKTVTVEQGLATKTENQVFESCTSTSKEEGINKEQAAVKESSLREIATVEEQKSLSQVESFDVSQREADSNATLTQSGIEVVVKEEQKSLQPLETLESLKSTTQAQQVVSCLNVAERNEQPIIQEDVETLSEIDSLSSSAVAIERDASVKSGTAVVKITETKVETCKEKEAKVEEKVKEKQSSESNVESVRSDKLQEVKETSKMESQSSSKAVEISENKKHITESVKEKTSEPTTEKTDSVIVEKESEKEKEVENANLGRLVEGELESAKSKLDEVRKILSADKKVEKDEESVESEEKNEKKDEIIVDEKQTIKSDENSKIETEKTVEVKEEKVKKEAEVQRKKVEDGSERGGIVEMETDRKLNEDKRIHDGEKKTEELGDRTEKKIEEESKDGSMKKVGISDEAELSEKSEGVNVKQETEIQRKSGKEEEKERKPEQLDSGIEAETKEKPGEKEGKQENSKAKSEKKPEGEEVEEIKVEYKDQTRKSENEATKAEEEKQKQGVEAQKKDEAEAKNKEAEDQKKEKEIEIRKSEDQDLSKLEKDSSIKTMEEKVSLENETKKTAGKEKVEVVDNTKSKTQKNKIKDEKTEEKEAKSMNETGVERGTREEDKKKAEDDKKAETEKIKLETDKTTKEKDTTKLGADAKKIELENKTLGEETKKKTDQEAEKKGETDFETKKKEEKKELEKVAEKTVEAHKELEKKNEKKAAEEKNELEAEAKAEKEKKKLDVETNKKDELERTKLAAEDKNKTETSEKKLEEETKKNTEYEKKKLDEKNKKMAEVEKHKLEHESNKESEEENKKLEMETKKKAEEEKTKVEEEEKKKAEEGKNKLESDAKKKTEEGKKLEESKKKSEEEKKKRDGDAKRKEEEEEKKIKEEAKKKAEEEQIKIEVETNKKAEEGKKKLESDSKNKAETEKKKLEEEAKKKSEEEKERFEEKAKKESREEKKELEEKDKKKAEEEKKILEAEIKKKAEDENKKIEEEAKKNSEEEKKKQEVEAKKKANEEKKKLEEENKKKVEEEKKKLEAEAKKKAEEENKKLEEENKKKAEEEKKKLEAEAKKKAEEEKKKLEEENKKKAEEEMKKQEEEKKKKAEEEKKKLEEENEMKAEDEKKKQEAEVKKKAEEEKKKLENENKKKAEEEKKTLQAEAKKKSEEEKKKLEAEAKKKAEEKKKLEEENMKMAEEEKKKLEEENKNNAEVEKKNKEAKAIKKMEEEKKNLDVEANNEADREKQLEAVSAKKAVDEEKKMDEKSGAKKKSEEETGKKAKKDEKNSVDQSRSAEAEQKKMKEENIKLTEQQLKETEVQKKKLKDGAKKNVEDETIDTNKVDNKNEKIETSVETDRGSQKKQDNLKQKSRVKADKTKESIELKNEKDGERKKGPKSEETEVTEVTAYTMEKRGNENKSFIDGISYEKSDKYSNVQLFIEEEINRETSKYDGAADRKIRSKSQESAFWISTTSEPKYKRDDSFASKPSEAPPRQTWAKRETKTKPYFCGRLMDRTAAQESRVKMSCSFIGNPEPTVAWLKDGLPLLHGASDPLAGRCETKVSNGVATIEIYSASPSDCGRYSCVVSSDLGQATTTATLRIFEKFEPTPSPPSFTRRIQDKYDFRADELTLECKVQGQPRPTITWRKDDKALPARGRYQQSESIDGTCRLVISGPEPQDSGVYTCHAENAVWNEQISDVVTFEGRASYAESARKETSNRIDYRRPFIANLLGDHTVPAGGTLALHVQLKEKSAGSQVTWYRGTEPLSRLSTRAKYFKEDDTYSLVLPEVKPQEAGLYMCRVSNAYGHSDTCANVQIITFGSHTQARGGKPAMFTRRPDTTLHIVSGEDVSVSFRLSGDPKPKVTWMKGLKDMTSNARSMKETIDDCTRLTLKRATIYDSGTYFIVAKNTYGCDRAFFTVHVRQRSRSLTPLSNYGVLDTQTILRDIHEISQASLQDVPGAISSEPVIADRGRTWMTITWGKPTHRGAAPILAYKVEAWQVGEHGGARWSELGVTPMNSFDAFDLTPGAAYRFRVTARNRYGWGEPVVTREPLTVVVCDQRAPEIVTDLPGSLKALVDTNLTLQCEVRGDPPPDIRWFHDGKEVAMARRACDRLLVSRRDGVCSLLIRDLQPRDSGRYVCEAASKLGRASTFARLLVVHDAKLLKAADRLRRVQEDELTTLDSPPQFSLRLRDRRIEVSYPIRLTCQVVGFPAPNITWLKDGAEIKADEHFRFCSEQGFVTLEISRSRMEDAGEYTAEARNEHGSVACTCRLVVDRGIKDYIAPAFLADIEKQATVREGATLRLRATVEAYPSVDIMWHRDGTRLRQSRRLTCTLDKEGHVEFTLADVTSRDAGTYTCTATNEVGRCECVCQVTVTPRLTSVPTSSADGNNQIADHALPYSQVPMFTMKPRSTDAVEGDTVILMCEVVGDPEPEIFCLRDGLKPDYYHHGPGFVSHREGQRYRLEIPQARLDYTGAYAIIARNQHGEARAVVSLQIYARGQGKEGTMSSGEVKQGKVQTLPEVRKELKDMRCCDGDSVTLECQLYATPPPDIRWLKDGKILALGGDVSSDVDGEVARLTISKVYPEDEGEYTCMAYNELGRALTSACLIVDVPEEKETMVTKQLSKPPGFLSTHSTPRTTPTRSISPGVQAVTRDFATPLNRPQRKRTKFSSPKFYAVPHNKVAQEGDTVKLQCSAAGHPNPWSSWDKDGHIVTPSARLTLLEQDDMRILQIKEVTPEDAGLYRVTLENDYGSVEATARLEVIAHKGTKTKGVRAWSASRASPTFGRRLVGSAARVGGNFTLACDVQASPSPNITWYRNTEVVVKSDRIHPLWDGRCARLKLTSLEREDAGVYTCVADNELGTTRCSAELLVLAEDDPSDADLRPPVFLTGLPATTHIPEGQPAELQVKLQGTQPLEVVWSKDKVELPDCMDFRYVDYGDGRFGLRIADAFPADAGHYSCEAFNKHGDAITYGHLQVTEQCESTDSTKKQLYFTKTPIPLEAEPGQSACFCARVHSAANTQVNIDWSVAGQPTSQQPQRFKVERDGDSTVLRIAAVQADDMGPISCRAHICLAGHTAPVAACAKCYVTSCTSRLSAVPTAEGWPAQLLHGPADTTALRGQRVILQAAYSGCPQPTVRWLKAGRELSNDAYMTIINEDGLSSLILDPVSADDSGKYVVSVENSHGADCHFASVAVEGPPDPPAGRPSVRTLNSTATIAWSSPPYDGGCMVTGYRVEMKKLPQTSWTVVTDRCHSLSHTVHDLVPGIDYVFRVRAENVHGASEASVETPIISIGSKPSSGSDEEEVAVEPRTWERVQVEPGHVFSSRYEIMEELGKGRYGVVHKVLDKLSNNKMAAKFVRCIKKQDKQKVLEEMDIMNCLRHPKLLQLVSAYDNTREIVMVTEYITGGELFERVVADDFTLTERDCMLFMRQICEGVDYMHQNSVVHLDLKPENIMCYTRTSHQIKIIDFGLAQKLSPNITLRVLFGTPEFIPPEIINYEPIGVESDMWSIGVICYVLLSGLSPFMGDNDAETFANITRADYDFDDEAFDAISPDVKHLISNLLVKRKEKRFSARQCLEHKWMSQCDKTMSCVKLSTDKLKKFIIRRKWQVEAVRLRREA